MVCCLVYAVFKWDKKNGWMVMDQQSHHEQKIYVSLHKCMQ